MRVAVLVKQVPALEEMRLGADGRLVRSGLARELNPYCRRAVAKGVELGECVVFTLGPPEAVEVLREAVAWGADRGVLITDPAFAGSDTLATARALAAALRREGPFDVVLTGRNSVDADTGQLGPQVAELLGLPFLGPVRTLDVAGDVASDVAGAGATDGAGDLAGAEVRARCERDDGYVHAVVRLPAVLSAAERLCAPAKVPAVERALVAAHRITVLTAADLGPGPWGEAGSPTRVGRTRVVSVERARQRGTGTLADQAAQAAVAMAPFLRAGAPTAVEPPAVEPPAVAPPAVAPRAAGGSAGAGGSAAGVAGRGVPAAGGRARVVVVLAEPDRDRATRELLGAARRLGRAVLVADPTLDARTAWSWGADELVYVPAAAPEDIAAAIAAATWPAARRGTASGVSAGASGTASGAVLPAAVRPWAVLAASTCRGREVAARVAAAFGAGLTGDAVDLELDGDRLVCWKPAFGGQLLAAVTATSATQLVTVRPGALPLPGLRSGAASLPVRTLACDRASRVRVTETIRDDDPDALTLARAVVGVGQGIDPADYPDLKPLLDVLGAELGATRKVTDLGWQPRSRQIGVTGASIAPDVYVALAVHGKFTHLAGVRRAGFVLAVNADPDAPVFDGADFGIVGDWREALPLLVRALTALR